MQDLTTFLDRYFFYIWLGLGTILLAIFYFGGRAAMRKLGPIDLSKAVYVEKSASGYSATGLNKGLGGANKVLHVIITDTELIITTYLLMAFIAKRIDLMQRIPLENILHTEIQKKRVYSKLIVRYETGRGKMKDIVISSKNNEQIKRILDKHVQASESLT
jgi:hypothetical protein